MYQAKLDRNQHLVSEYVVFLIELKDNTYDITELVKS